MWFFPVNRNRIRDSFLKEREPYDPTKAPKEEEKVEEEKEMTIEEKVKKVVAGEIEVTEEVREELIKYLRENVQERLRGGKNEHSEKKRREENQTQR